MYRVLLVEDEEIIRKGIRYSVPWEEYGCSVVAEAENGAVGEEKIAELRPDIVITDMKMPRISGREVLERVKKNWPHIPVLIMTAFGSIESAVEAMKYGAFDYITKPFSNDELLLSIHNATELARAHRQYRLLQEAMEERYSVHQIVGRSRAIRDVLVMVDRAAPSRSTVLITGESGTGKELVARAIHYASPRKEKPFVSVNCMALNPGVLESELFGHEKGSFTGAVAMRRGRFEQADGGTLFLDEIAELTPDLQVKLLRVLQERRFERVGGGEEIEVDIRVVAATNKDLAAMVEKGTFRDDLYYRLNVVQIPLPALRERREDIPLLVSHFMDKVARENDMPAKKFTTEALNYLSGYEWPGNIRQLENVVESCMVLVPGTVIDVDNLPAEIRDEDSQFKSAVDLLPVQLDLADTLEKIEAALIRRALVRADLVQVKAAELLALCRDAGVPFVVNDSVEVALECGADGVHVGQSDLPCPVVRAMVGPDKIVGATAKTVPQAAEAYEQGADYLGVGAIYPTTTKVKTVLTSTDTLRDICKAVPIPVNAIGGLNKTNIDVLCGIPIAGICVVSAIMKADDPRQAAVDLRDRAKELGIL